MNTKISMTRKEIIAKMELARESHYLWAKLQRRSRTCGKPPEPSVGCESFHRHWIKVYDAVIELIQKDGKRNNK